MTVSFCSWSAEGQPTWPTHRRHSVTVLIGALIHPADAAPVKLQSTPAQQHSGGSSLQLCVVLRCTGVIQRSALFTPAFRSAQSESCFTNGVAYVLEFLACNLTDHNKLFCQVPDSMLNFFNWQRPFPELLKLNLWLTGWLTSPLLFWQ